MKKLLLTGLLVLLTACGDEKPDGVVTYRVTQDDYEIQVKAEGICRAVKATPVKVPTNVRSAMIISWIIPEGSEVKKGDELVRFDDSQLLKSEADQRTNLAVLGHETDVENRQSDEQLSNLNADIFVTTEEKDQAISYAPKNEHLFSREEIIEGEMNIRFLDAKVDYLETNRDRHGEKSKAQTAIRNLRKESLNLELTNVLEQKQTLVITAPHDGSFYYRRNWRGEAPKVGQNVWRGMDLGELPDTSAMEAKVYVLESEAAGLKPELDAEVVLDARPGHAYKARVKSVAGLAVALERGNPVKYFEVVLSFDQTDHEFMKPGSFATATIVIEKQVGVLAVPNQALFEEDGAHWIYVATGKDYERRKVKPGKRGPTRTVIEEGLSAGESIALSVPEDKA
ncbi:MAG: HlyD family efflux transporter periplasmic adaptor subunit [Acidobacteriota bacterium]|nr:HlyD family efflux transporter periplasmic adaptor subunit [Acidobacteriota bacterium]